MPPKFIVHLCSVLSYIIGVAYMCVPEILYMPNIHVRPIRHSCSYSRMHWYFYDTSVNISYNFITSKHQTMIERTLNNDNFLKFRKIPDIDKTVIRGRGEGGGEHGPHKILKFLIFIHLWSPWFLSFFPPATGPPWGNFPGFPRFPKFISPIHRVHI